MKIIFLDFDGVIRIPVLTGGPRIEVEFPSMRGRLVSCQLLDGYTEGRLRIALRLSNG